MTPSDEAEPYIDDIKAILLREMGALCHVTLPRDGNRGEIALRSRHSLQDFCKIWSEFDSELLRFKSTTWGVKRDEFCYAGAWSGLLDLGDGEMYACYGSPIHVNVFKNLSKPIKFNAVGRHCAQPHCYNSHAFLTLGLIPELENAPTYAQMRDRKQESSCGEMYWLNESMHNTMIQKMYDNNPLFTEQQKRVADRLYRLKILERLAKKIPDKIKYELRKRERK